jgi:hypothetical protein
MHSARACFCLERAGPLWQSLGTVHLGTASVAGRRQRAGARVARAGAVYTYLERVFSPAVQGVGDPAQQRPYPDGSAHREPLRASSVEEQAAHLAPARGARQAHRLAEREA